MPFQQHLAASPAGQRLEAFLAERVAAGATIYPPEPLRALKIEGEKILLQPCRW